MAYRTVREFFFFNTWSLFTIFVSCNGPCAPKEKWHRKEHIIIIIIIINHLYGNNNGHHMPTVSGGI